MHLTQLPISFSELTISSPRASIGVANANPNGAMNLPWVIRRRPSYFVSPFQHDYIFANGSRYENGGGPDVLAWSRDAGNRALGSQHRYVKSVVPRAVLAAIPDWSSGRNLRGLGHTASLSRLAFTSAGYVRGPRPALDGSPVSERVNALLPATGGAVDRHTVKISQIECRKDER